MIARNFLGSIACTGDFLNTVGKFDIFAWWVLKYIGYIFYNNKWDLFTKLIDMEIDVKIDMIIDMKIVMIIDMKIIIKII